MMDSLKEVCTVRLDMGTRLEHNGVRAHYQGLAMWYGTASGGVLPDEDSRRLSFAELRDCCEMWAREA